MSGANRCPKCGSPDITADTMEADCLHAWQEVECLACEFVWQDVFTLTGISAEGGKVVPLPQKRAAWAVVWGWIWRW